MFINKGTSTRYVPRVTFDQGTVEAIILYVCFYSLMSLLKELFKADRTLYTPQPTLGSQFTRNSHGQRKTLSKIQNGLNKPKTTGEYTSVKDVEYLKRTNQLGKQGNIAIDKYEAQHCDRRQQKVKTDKSLKA